MEKNHMTKDEKAQAKEQERQHLEREAKAHYRQACLDLLLLNVGVPNAKKTAQDALAKAERDLKRLFPHDWKNLTTELSTEAVHESRKSKGGGTAAA